MLRDRPPPITFLLNHLGPMSSFAWEQKEFLSTAVEITVNLDFWRSYKSKNDGGKLFPRLPFMPETHAKLVMKLFEAASWFCLTREESILTPDCCSEWLHSLLVACDLYSLFDQSQVWTDAYTDHIWRSWYNGPCTMMAKPIKTLELHYPMIQAYYYYF